ncbi:MAG: FAD-dependent monooxygenase [Proteobacteria bacterium]|nr:FAD-dependent monooxygenase [Pseudomonadota bacterium]
MAGQTEVLIVGAGPVGLTLANELARYGVAFRIVDQAAQRTDKSKALVLWSRTLELFDRAGYVDTFLAAGMKGHGAQITTGDETIAQISLDAIDSPYPYALMIPQSETERILEERLAKHGVTVERSVTLERFSEREGGFDAVLRKASGETETVPARWLAGCDGAHSTVRHGLGLAFEGTTEPSDWYLADGHISGLEPQDLLHIFWHKDGILAFFPIVGGRWRVVADVGPAQGEGRRPDPTLEDVQALMTARGSKAVITDPYWLASFRINERKVAHYGRGRAFLAGDAAHVHSPAGGQGMNTGMQDAFNLAWKLALVIRGICKPALLDSYSIERSAVGDMVLRNASRMTEAAVMRNPIAQGLRNAVARFALGFPQLQHHAANTLAEVDIAYPDSPLTAGKSHGGKGRKAGDRWRGSLPADDSTPRFIAIGPAEAVSGLQARFPQLIQAVPAKEAVDAGALSLVRPDGYVGFAGAASDGEAAAAYLQALAAQ